MAENKKWDGKARGGTKGNAFFINLIRITGLMPAYIFCAFIAWTYIFKDPKAVKALREFRSKLGFKRTSFWHLFRHFYTFGIALIDKIAFMTKKKTPFTFTYQDDYRYFEALEKNKGVIIVSGHIGNWEIAGNEFAGHYKNHIHAVILDNEQEEIKEVFSNVYSNRLFSTIPFSSEDMLAMMIPVREALKKNELVCFHGDRTINEANETLPFLGTDAQFPTGPFLTAAITGAPVLPVFLVKTGLYHFTSVTFPPIYFDDVNRNNRQVRIRVAIEEYVGNLETIVKQYPYQWYNFFSIWE